MKAIVICDFQFDLAHGFKTLSDELKLLGIELIPFSSGYAITAKAGELGTDPVLFYPNVWTRYENPQAMLKFHTEHPGFESLVIEDEPVTYFPKNLACYNNSILNRDQLLKGAIGIGHRFKITNYKKTQIRPLGDPPRIFVICHNRTEYLHLTLNALKFSLNGDEPVTLLLNGVSQQVLPIADKYLRLPNVDVLEIRDNCFYSALNLGLQWYRPEKFIIFEDDFILPSTAKYYYPNWVHQFGARMDTYNLVGWAPATDNSPAFHRMSKSVTAKPFGDWEYKMDGKPLLLGNALGARLDFYLDVLKKDTDHWYAALDSKLHKHSKDYCTPTLKAYHIGWNQDMDYEASPKVPGFRPPLKNLVKDWKTGEGREMSLENILL